MRLVCSTPGPHQTRNREIVTTTAGVTVAELSHRSAAVCFAHHHRSTQDPAAAGAPTRSRVGQSCRCFRHRGDRGAGLRRLRRARQPYFRGPDRGDAFGSPRRRRRCRFCIQRGAAGAADRCGAGLARRAHPRRCCGVGAARRSVRGAGFGQRPGCARVVASGARAWLPGGGPPVTPRAAHRASVGSCVARSGISPGGRDLPAHRSSRSRRDHPGGRSRHGLRQSGRRRPVRQRPDGVRQRPGPGQDPHHRRPGLA